MKIKGFTLIELVVTLFLFTFITFFFLTAMGIVRDKNDKRVIIDEIRTILQYAKVQALYSGTLLLRPVDPSPDWSKGMKLMQYQRDKMLYQWKWHHPHWSVSWRGASTVNQIVISDHPAHAMSNGKFILFNPYTKERIIIVLNRLGRINIQY